MARAEAGGTTGRGSIEDSGASRGATVPGQAGVMPARKLPGTRRRNQKLRPVSNLKTYATVSIEEPNTGVRRIYRVPYDRMPAAHEVTMSHSPSPGATLGTHAGEGSVRSSLLGRVERWLRRSLERMSDAEVLKLIEAQSPAETIAEILVATPETSAASENDWAELLLRGAEAKRQITELVGGLMTSSQAAKLLNISVPGVKQRVERHKLLAMPLPGGQWGFPALQFAEDGRVRPGVPEVAKAGAHVDAWALLSILVDDVPDKSGGLILERLGERAVLDDVLNRLATYGEHVAG